MHRAPIILLFALLGSLPAFAAGRIEAIVNHACFYGANGVPQLEMYWEVTPASLHYQKDSSGKISTRIHTNLRISCDTGTVKTERYVLQTTPFNPEGNESPRIFEIVRQPVPAGHISIELQLVEEAHPESSFYFSDTFTIAPAATAAYSSLQLLDTFYEASGKPDLFLKGGYKQIPRPLNFYDDGQRSIHSYLELYAAPGAVSVQYPLTQGIWISASKGGPPIAGQIQRDTIKNAAAVHVFRRTFSSAAMPSGNYFLNAALQNAQGVVLANATQFFQTLNRHPDEPLHDTAGIVKDGSMTVEGTFLDLSSTFAAKFNVAQMRAVLKMMLPSASPTDENTINGFLQNPQELYMRYFIYNHFLAINRADPAKAWKDFSEQIRDINRRFSAGGTMGYETDRGKIYLRYGPPAEQISTPSEAGAQPYEIWRYNAGGKLHSPGLFLFYSPGYAASDYRLLHSNVPGEKQQPGWRAYLYSSGRSSGNLNSRAEEFFGNEK